MPTHPAPTELPRHAVRRVWECDYQRDRRKHRHRCMACSRIIEPGDRALMVRLRNRTKAVHATCADTVAEPTSGTTYRGLFALWAEATR